jgi:sec-independent protein translocase protein TatC
MPGARTFPSDNPGDSMLRMSFMEHLEELRSRLLKSLAGVGVAFAFSILFTNQLWRLVSQPVDAALRELGLHQNLVFTAPMEAFNTVWVKLPMLAAVFLASPWVLYQVWAFIAPGLYESERRWATPFVLSTAGLFVAGGLFSYFIAFRYGLTFLLGVGRDLDIQPMVAVSEYFDLFINVTLGIGVVFELPVLLFLLTLLHIVSPAFLMSNSRYAVLALTLIAAVISPTQDVINLMVLLVPMCALSLQESYSLVGNNSRRWCPHPLDCPLRTARLNHTSSALTASAFSTPVSRISSPWYRYVNRSWSIPNRRRIVAWKSRT